MVKVHPEGVISVSNSSEILPVDSKNGSERHKLKKKKSIKKKNHRAEKIQRGSKLATLLPHFYTK